MSIAPSMHTHRLMVTHALSHTRMLIDNEVHMTSSSHTHTLSH